MASAMPVLPEVASISVSPGWMSPRSSARRIMLMAGRSFTEPAGLLPSSLPRITLPRRVVVGAGQALQAHQRRVADGVFQGLVARRGLVAMIGHAALRALWQRRARAAQAACDNPPPSACHLDAPHISPRDEIGRRRGLKIRRRKACQFESGRGHQPRSRMRLRAVDSGRRAIPLQRRRPCRRFRRSPRP